MITIKEVFERYSNSEDLQLAICEWTKLHVREALKQANENASNSKCRPDYCESDVLNAYDLDNIK